MGQKGPYGLGSGVSRGEKGDGTGKRIDSGVAGVKEVLKRERKQ